ncbi:MAG: phosphoribosylanthranilate isomerase [Acidobacteriota bacterium]
MHFGIPIASALKEPLSSTLTIAMTWIKICGTTNLEDAQLAVEAGADALGFVFYGKSPRYINPEAARNIVEQLPENIEKVGVFVDSGAPDVVAIVNDVRLTAVQWHMPADPAQVRSTPPTLSGNCFGKHIDVYPSFPFSWFKNGATLPTGPDFNVEPRRSKYAPKNIPGPPRMFLDSGTSEIPGGTGKTFDWEKAFSLTEQLRKAYDIVIAGGLTPANVQQAISKFHPFGVDVVSGVEARPGRKDPEKIRAFIDAVRQADKSA